MAIRTLLMACVFFALSACAMAPGMYLTTGDFKEPESRQEEERQDVTIIPVTPSLIRGLSKDPVIVASSIRLPDQNIEYRVGPQDVLSIVVWEHPELTIPAGEQRPVEKAGHRVTAEGTIFYPYVGLVSVAGKTTEEIRLELTERLSRYIKRPQLDVRVVAFNSQKIHVTGEVKQPGNITVMDVPLTLIDAVNLSGGATDQGDLEQVLLTRDGKKLSFNVQALYQHGDMSQNLLLRGGDIVYVPANVSKKVYVMGEVKTPGVLPLNKGRLTLAEVLSTGGIEQNSADASKIFVLRQIDGKAYAYHLDASEPDALILATAFKMQPLDVVFISTANVSRWNRVLTQLLPTVQTLWTLDRIAETQ